jgi:ubiquinol-cytochrome c reductase cytochrome b subunit
MKRFFDWLDQRTGCRKLTHEALFENVPGGSRWRYVWGSTLSFALVVQFITGVFLWMAYSPSSQTAWESVYYIQHEMTGGWFLRGIHHFMAQAMTILLVLHLMQVVIDGAYKAPREINFWFGIGLLVLTLALSLTGYLLPWDQKGFWATQVTTNLMGIAPVVGPLMQKVLVGGAEFGHHTLTRFFALHAGVLPGLVVALLVAHIYLFRRHGLTPKQPLRKKDEAFWPEQVLKDSVACLAVLAAVLVIILLPRLKDAGAPLGAELGAPADPTEPYSAARPEWYFLFLFQFLKYFPGKSEIIGAIIIPTLVLGLICIMPLLGRWRLGHRFNIGLLFAVIMGAGLLTYLAMAQDRGDAGYRLALQEAHEHATRVKELAASGIPQSGALSLLHSDPFTQGPKIFARNCASCHSYDGHDGTGTPLVDAATGADLKGFASRDWIAGMLDPAHVDSSNYFGNTKFKDGKMVRFVKRTVSAFSDAEKEQLKKVIKALSAEAALPSQAEMDEKEAAEIEEGRRLIANETMRCTECHQFRKKDEDATAPDLTGYGSIAWLTDFVKNPAHDHFYGKRNDRMPAFGVDNRLDEKSLGLVVDWLRGEWPRSESKVAQTQGQK